MPYEKGQHPGAVWRKSDLQCHSPRDRNWNGPPSLPGGTPEFEDARKQWAIGFIGECATRAIQLVAITDHHDMTFVPYVVDAARSERFTLVFPGVEVTCNDNTQCLVLFDPSAGPDDWGHLLGKLNGITRAPANDPKTAPTVNADMTMRELFEAAAADRALLDKYIIIPHFSDGNAHKHLNEPGHHERFAQLDCDSVYIEKRYVELEGITKDKAYGRIHDWGSRRRAIVATGDNRDPAWDRLGAHECWIKLGEDTVEALRQAFLADEARITYDVPVVPSEQIAQLSVMSSLTGNELFSVTFNDGFNALIGGRGSGKSALLEYLRFGLGRTARDLAGSDAEYSVGYDRDAQLIEDTLGEDGYVEVAIAREGVRETWYRDLRDRDAITITSEDGEASEFTIGDAQRRFPARAFYQKGLSTTMNDAENAAEQITGIAAAEQLDKRREIDFAIEKAKREIGTTLRRQSAYWQIQLERKQAQERIADIKRRIAAIAARLEKEGVQKTTLDVIAQAPVYDRAKNYHGQVSRTRISEVDRFSTAKKSVLNVSIASFAGIDSFVEIKELNEAVQATRNRIVKYIDAILKDLEKLGADYTASLSAFETRDAAYRTDLQKAVEAQRAHKQLLDDSGKLTAELRSAEATELEIGESEDRTKEAPEKFTTACRELDRLLSERTRVLSEAAHKVEKEQSRLLKAKFKRDPQPRECVEALVKLLSGARIQDLEAKCQEWVSALSRHDANPSWVGVRRSILDLYKAKILAGSPSEPSDEQLANIRKLFFTQTSLTRQQSQRVYQNLDDSTLSDIYAAVARDYIVMTYIDQGHDVEFEKASPGQQASALLELLLSQSAGTLIIDQPEDDLDNRVIMDIVSQIRTSKSRRQLLFATHNPNIVVNGDADKVVALKSGDYVPGARVDARIQIDVDGAIETRSVRDAITHLMEGGKLAFDLRSRKYNFAG
jgi:chromosome segregation protein